jgi:prepilin-type N-terminal cleavage/methylation domain-containing protein
MFKQVQKLREKEEGFTLIELLVVIAILGILAGVVVFAVQGLGDKGQANACKIDTRTIKTAEEGFFSQLNRYGTMDELTGVTPVTPPGGTAPVKFLDSASTLHNITAASGVVGSAPGADYGVVVASAKCGAPPALVNTPAATPTNF